MSIFFPRVKNIIAVFYIERCAATKRPISLLFSAALQRLLSYIQPCAADIGLRANTLAWSWE